MKADTVMFGCQTFTWEMLGKDWTGGPDDLVEAVAAGGYAGLEITDVMIGAYGGRPEAFRRRLEDAGLTLVAFAFGSAGGFTEPGGVPADLEAARRWSDFAAHFPGALVSMGSATVMSEGAREEKFSVAADVYARAAEIGGAAEVGVAVHPSSHHDTLLLSRSDYDALFALLPTSVGWVPDTGHMLRGGHDMAATVGAHLARMRYLHLKDVDAAGDWAMLGTGVCDVAGVIDQACTGPAFNGWVVVEEESAAATEDPARAVRLNRDTLRAMGDLQT